MNATAKRHKKSFHATPVPSRAGRPRRRCAVEARRRNTELIEWEQRDSSRQRTRDYRKRKLIKEGKPVRPARLTSADIFDYPGANPVTRARTTEIRRWECGATTRLRQREAARRTTKPSTTTLKHDANTNAYWVDSDDSDDSGSSGERDAYGRNRTRHANGRIRAINRGPVNRRYWHKNKHKYNVKRRFNYETKDPIPKQVGKVMDRLLPQVEKQYKADTKRIHKCGNCGIRGHNKRSCKIPSVPKPRVPKKPRRRNANKAAKGGHLITDMHVQYATSGTIPDKLS